MPRYLILFLVCLIAVVGCAPTEAAPPVALSTATPLTRPVVVRSTASATPYPATATPSPTATATPLPSATATATIIPTPLPIIVTPKTTINDGTWTTRLNHLLRFQFDAPPLWQMSRATRYGTSLEAPEVTFNALDYAAITDSRTLCDTIPNSSETLMGVGRIAQIGELEICTLAPSADADPTSAFLFYPQPLPVRAHIYANGTYTVLQVTVANPEHLFPIVETVRFPEAPSGRLFAEGVFDLLQAMYYFRGDVNWSALRQEVLAPLTAESTMEQGYEQTRYLVTRLRQLINERHMFVRGARVIQGLQSGNDNEIGVIFNDVQQVTMVLLDSPASEAGIQIGDMLLSINGASPFNEDWKAATQVTVRIQRGDNAFDAVLTPRPLDGILHSQGWRVSEGVSYVATFGINSNRAQFEQYVDETHRLIADLDSPAQCGWIVDLRRNNGGTIAPILAALGPFVGDGEIYRVRRVDGEESVISLQGAEVYGRGIPGSNPFTENPYRLQNPNIPIAVLIGPGTVSAGELSVMMLRGRLSNIRLIGGDTYGLTTTLAYVDLYDRGQLWIPVAGMVGPDGRDAPYGISPDEYVRVLYTPDFGTLADGGIQAAQRWLANQGCS